MNLIIFIIFSPFVFSQVLTIRDIIKMAENYSPQIRGESYGLKMSEAQLRQSRIFSNPIFTLQTGSIKSSTQSGAVADLSVNQPLPWPGKRGARVLAQKFILKLSELSLEEARLEVSHRVYVLSSELAALQELESHYAERKRRFGLIEKSLKSRPQASPKQKADRDLIESQINLMEKGMIDLVARKESLLWELRTLTNGTFDRVLFPWDSLPAALNKDQFLTLIDTSPNGKRMKIQRDLSENKIEQARLEARPDFMVGVNYRQENIAPVNHFYHGQVSVVIPIIDYGQHSVEGARAEKMRTNANHHFERNHMTSLIHQYFAEYEASIKSVEVFKLKNLRQVENKFYDAEKSFRKGFIDALTFLQVDSQVHENIDNIYLSRVEYVIALSKLNLLVGREPQI